MANLNVQHTEPISEYNSPMSMGARIKENRLRLGLTQEQLGEKVGVSKVAVSLWESDTTENIRLQTFLALCDILQCDPHYLIFGPGRGAEVQKEKHSAG